MLLWRTCSAAWSDDFTGEGGVLAAGRWHSKGQLVSYAATAPSLTVLERLVHVEDPNLLPPLSMVVYDVPDALEVDEVRIETLDADWREKTTLTRRLGDDWLKSRRTPLLRVPSAIVPLPGIPDLNVVINHGHTATKRIRIVRKYPFKLDARLLRDGARSSP